MLIGITGASSIVEIPNTSQASRPPDVPGLVITPGQKLALVRVCPAECWLLAQWNAFRRLVAD